MQTKELIDYLSKIVTVEEALYETQMLQDNLRIYKACYEQMKRESFVECRFASFTDVEKLSRDTDEQIVKAMWKIKRIDSTDDSWPTDEFVYDDYADEDAESDVDESCDEIWNEYTTQLRASAEAHFERPVLKNKPQKIAHHIEWPDKPSAYSLWDFTTGISLLAMLLTAVFFAVYTFVLSGDNIAYMNVAGVLVASAVLAIIVSVIAFHFYGKKTGKREAEEYERKLAECNKLRAEENASRAEMEEWDSNSHANYAKALKTAMQRAQADCGQDAELRIAYFDNEINRLGTVIDDLKKSLQALYDRDVIFRKYREWPICATMLEYLQAGRCKQLEGPNGAYNLYESELRQERIIRELSEIREMLDEIRSTMYMMYHAIEKTNRHLENLNKQVRGIAKLSAAQLQAQLQTNSLLAVNNAYAAATAANTEATKYLTLVR